MKKVSLFLIVMSVVLLTSCTTEEIVTKKDLSTKENVKEQYSDVDPTTIKPPTHG